MPPLGLIALAAVLLAGVVAVGVVVLRRDWPQRPLAEQRADAGMPALGRSGQILRAAWERSVGDQLMAESGILALLARPEPDLGLLPPEEENLGEPPVIYTRVSRDRR